MKLYQTYTSPFPTRVRLVLYVKGIEVEIIEPSGFHTSAEGKGDYLDINPIGRVPTLVLDDGRALPESEVICEYLEDAFPEPRVNPAEPWARAQVRLISRLLRLLSGDGDGPAVHRLRPARASAGTAAASTRGWPRWRPRSATSSITSEPAATPSATG